MTSLILNPMNLRCLSCEAFFFFVKVCTHRQVESLFFLRRRKMLSDTLTSYINCYDRCCFYFFVLANKTTSCPTDLPPGIKNCPEASFTVSVTQRRVNVDQSFCYENNNNNNKKELMVGNDVPPDVVLSYISQRQYFALTAASTSR